MKTMFIIIKIDLSCCCRVTTCVIAIEGLTIPQASGPISEDKISGRKMNFFDTNRRSRSHQKAFRNGSMP